MDIKAGKGDWGTINLEKNHKSNRVIYISYCYDTQLLSLERKNFSFNKQHKLMLKSHFGFTEKGFIFVKTVSSTSDATDILSRTIDCFGKWEIDYTLTEKAKKLWEAKKQKEREFEEFRLFGEEFKNGKINLKQKDQFLDFEKKELTRRPLKKHQVRAAQHLLGVKHGANFSVPGSGKTSVVIAVYRWLKFKRNINSLFVVGPTSCFNPWITEYEYITGQSPNHSILSGGDSEIRKNEYIASPQNYKDLYLTSFQTLRNDVKEATMLLSTKGLRFFLVIDEAHYIKQDEGEWAKAILTLAPHAEKRCILTGTPLPRSYTDAFNLFDFLWLDPPVLPKKAKHEISDLCQHQKWREAGEILRPKVYPFFYRVSKQELELKEQKLETPIMIPMNKAERKIYNAISSKISKLAQEDTIGDIILIRRLRRARIIRLRQCLSYPALLNTSLDQETQNIESENLWAPKGKLDELIREYGQLKEKPAKLEKLIELTKDITEQGHRVVIWSNFIGTLDLIADNMKKIGKVNKIYGDTPREESMQSTSNHSGEYTRESIIRDFTVGDLQILVANPAACAESVSLHKECNHAIYYDLSYNCAQYLQSLDRIHRVGGSEKRPSFYKFLCYEDTIENKILKNLADKAERMAQIIDENDLTPLDGMFAAEEEDLNAYEMLFLKKVKQNV